MGNRAYFCLFFCRKKREMIYLYKLNNKWRIGPDFESPKAWMFTKTGELTDQTVWYTVIYSHVKFPKQIGTENGNWRRQETDYKVIQSVENMLFLRPAGQANNQPVPGLPANAVG